MPGLPRILWVLVFSGLLAGGAGPAAHAQSEGDRFGALAPGSAIGPRRDGSEVDAFLGLSRSARIAQVMTRHVPQCAPEEDVEEVAERLQQLQVRRLLVLDGRDRLLGSVGLSELRQGPRTAREDDEDIFVRPRV